MDRETKELFEYNIDKLLQDGLRIADLYPSRRLSMAITKLEEALMWAERIKVDE